MDQASAVGLGERSAHLAQQVGGARRGQRAIALHQVGQGQALEEFHGVVQGAAGSLAEIVDGDGVGMAQRAGELHFPLEAGGPFLRRGLGLEHLDRHRPLEQAMARQVHGADGAFADGAHQPVGADAAQGLPAAQAPGQPVQGDEGAEPDQGHQGQHRRQPDVEVAQRRIGFGRRHFQGHAHVMARQPAPGADDFLAQVVAVGLEQQAGAVGALRLVARGDGGGGQPGEGPRLGRGAVRPVGSQGRIAHLQGEDGAVAGARRQQPPLRRLAQVARFAQHDAIGIEGIGLPGAPRARRLEHVGEGLVGEVAEPQDGDDLAVGVLHRRLHPHQGPVEGDGLGLHHPRLLMLRRDEARFAAQDRRQLLHHLGRDAAAEIAGMTGDDDAAAGVDHMGRHGPSLRRQ